MKRIVALIVAMLMIVCTLAACGDSSDSKEEEKPATFNGTTKDVDLSGVMNLINERFDFGEKRDLSDSERYYGISTPDVAQFYAQKPINDNELNEIVICEAANPDAVSRIENRLQKPLDTAYNQAKSYSKDDLAIVEKCAVRKNGKYVYLVISPHAAEIEALIESQIN